MAPAPTTRTRIARYPCCCCSSRANSEWRVANREGGFTTPPFAIRHSLFAFLPLLAEWSNLEFEGPGAARLLVKLPVGRRDGGRWHQQIRIIKRFLAPELLAALAHPGGVDAGIDDQMRDMDVFGPEFAGHRLRHGAKPEFGAGKGGEPLPPRTDAVAPVKKMLPLPRGSIRRADSRPARKPAQQAISQTFRKTRSVV